MLTLLQYILFVSCKQ